MFAEHTQWERWERIRSGGRGRYVWLYGVCGFGLSLGCLMAIFIAIDLISSRHPVPAIAVVPLLLGPLFGYVFGLVSWHNIEAKYLAVRAAARAEQDLIAALDAVDALASEVKELRESLKKQSTTATPHRQTGITERGT